MEATINVPKDRIAVIIGTNGKTKKDLEQRAGIKINIDTENNEVLLESTEKTEPVNLFHASNVIKAIARGFSPENAYLLFEDDYYFDQINLVDFLGKSEKALMNKKGRIIGKGGKAREEIENMTNTAISVYGKTVSIIGKADGIRLARKCIEMLIEGAAHQTVYKYLNKQKEKAQFGEIDI